MTKPPTPMKIAAMFDPRDQSACRPVGKRNSVLADSIYWSILRVSEADRARILEFRPHAVLMAGEYEVPAVSSFNAPVTGDELTTGHTWIAEAGEKVVGFVSLMVNDLRARITALYVETALRNSLLPTDLLGHALRFCRDAGVLKVVLKIHLPEEEVWRRFAACGYVHDITRRRQHGAHHVLEFYLDLYGIPECEAANS
jgi:GNAT superfamily N-acetyltransferase